ncbi:MAG: TRAP transporter large permease subunit [Pseudomonadota bacterium]
MTAPLSFIAVLLAITLAGGVWVGFALMSVGILSLEVFKSLRVDRFLASDLWSTAVTEALVTLPLFILMGEILFHTRLSQNLFAGLAPFVRRLPGRLLHVNVLGCTLFAAVSGSSAATTATVGRITLKELESRGYSPVMAAGSLAGSGTIGFLIPPSIPLIIYGILAEVSILELFIAGVIPGLMLALMFMVYIGGYSLATRGTVPPPDPSTSWAQKGIALTKLLPITVLIGFVLGTMYAGWASVTEAAAMGVFGALLLSLWEGTFTFSMIRGALMGTVRTCSMIGLILAGALFMSKAMARLAIPTEVAASIEALNLAPWQLILLLMAFYLALGCFIDGLSTIVMTLPVTLPLVTAAGFDPVWFGIFLILTIEMAQITPPIGFNLFVIKSLTDIPLGRLAVSAAPFCGILILLVVLILIFPGIVSFLPDSMRG